MVRALLRARRIAHCSTAPRVRGAVYRLAGDVAVRVRAGHPWVFREALGARSVVEPTGALVDLLAGNREFVARGFVDQQHAIAVRILARRPDENVAPGAGAITARFRAAADRRARLFGEAAPEAMRLFSGESEGLPGVTVDRYGDFVVVQWLSGGALPWRDELLDVVEAVARPRGIFEQKRLRPLGGGPPPEPAALARGERAPLEVPVGEADCRMAVDLTAPLGVGFFPDMRLGRAAVAARAAGRRVLNLFSYTGGFSVRAAKAGAAEVVAVDLAAKAHARARRNYELSGLDPASMEAVTGDAMQALDRFAARGRRFDLVVCDPPTFAHGPGRGFQVSRDLPPLAGAALAALEPGGLLAFATNSTKVSAADLDRAIGEGGADRGIDVCVVGRVGLPPDYPVAPGFPEGNYLKFVLCTRA